MTSRILFTGGGGAGNVAIFALLGGRYQLFFADADVSAINPAIPQESRHAIPRADHADFVAAVAVLCRALRIDVLVPGVDEELHHLAALRDALGTNTSVLAPQHDLAVLMLDKFALMQALAECAIPVPQTLLFTEHHHLDYPLVFKPRSGRGSRGVHLVNNLDELRCHRRLAQVPDEALIVQQCASGQEYTVMMVADSRCRLRAVVPVRVDDKRGITIRAATERNDAVTAYCRTVHDAFGVSGIYNIQLIETADGAVLPFEINPRISTTSCLGIAAGIDPVAIHLADGDDTSLLPFDAPKSLRRHWSNHIE